MQCTDGKERDHAESGYRLPPISLIGKIIHKPAVIIGDIKVSDRSASSEGSLDECLLADRQAHSGAELRWVCTEIGAGGVVTWRERSGGEEACERSVRADDGAALKAGKQLGHASCIHPTTTG